MQNPKRKMNLIFFLCFLPEQCANDRDGSLCFPFFIS